MSCSVGPWHFLRFLVQIRDCIRKATPVNCVLGFRITCKVCLLWEYLKWWDVHWRLDYRALWDMHSCNSDSWIRYTLRGLCWCVEGEMRKLVQHGDSKRGLPCVFLCGTSGKGKRLWSLVIFFIFMVLGRTKRWCML